MCHNFYGGGGVVLSLSPTGILGSCISTLSSRSSRTGRSEAGASDDIAVDSVFRLVGSSSTSTMEIKVGPTSVQHKVELATLFLSPTTARSEAKTLLAGLGDTPHFFSNQHLHDLVLSSHNWVIVGHTTDPSGYNCMDLMLLNMGLVTSRTAGQDTPLKAPDIQYGTALVHFYPSLGGEAALNWEILYLSPTPPKISVSAHPCLT
jgi:hypothetical protein